MQSSLIGKIQKANLYAREPDRVTFSEFSTTFRGENDTHTVAYRETRWDCDCQFFGSNGICSHVMAIQKLVPNAVSAVQEELQDLLQRDGVDAIVFCGGTGFSPRDLTVDAVRPHLEREVEGFGELFRALSYAEIGTAAMLSRALGGVARRRAVFCLPGSPKAVRLAIERLILPELGHLLGQVRREP